MIKSNEQKIQDILSRGVKEIIERESLVNKLRSGKQLKIKFGIDPTSCDLHLGHSVVLNKLREFQILGHKIILVIGDFTATIGDPSGKSAARPELTEKQVKMNMKNYIQQASKILDMKKSEIEIMHNGEWFKKMKMNEFYSLARIESVWDLLHRSMFRERQDSGESLTLSEFTYPLLQAYDSFHIKADIELGGIDQLFNMKHGRELQKKLGQNPQDVIGLKLLVGLDGIEKMSKSLGNHIGLNDSPKNMYGKIMSIKDELIEDYIKLCLPSNKEINLREIPSNPRDKKASLAKEIVKIYHGEKEAQKAEKEFNKIFRDKEIPTDVQIFQTDKTTYPILDLLFDCKLTNSKSEGKRLVEGGGVTMRIKNEELKIKNWKETVNIEDGMIVKIGKRKFIRIKLIT